MSATKSSPSILSVAWASYLQSLQKRPVITKSVTSGVIYCLGDILGQKIEQYKAATANTKYDDIDEVIVPQYDIGRTIKFGIFGLLINAPLIHYWYKFLDWLLQNVKGAKLVWIQLFLDEIIFGPIYLVIYYYVMGIMNGTLKNVPKKIKRELIPTAIESLKVWVPVQYINFKLVPPHLRVLFGNLVALGWNAYFSIISNKNK
eukprot:TRINITY_DN1328_c0_g1_i4.p1 TRINITY_DN1328_c0_g1~~TRINITY_DN1328_c0_g1_i4.p1  ORF type:complete len:203 (+),score=22.46 TRINITY_DN1328_c0_g1_i4:40-648(+)